MSNFIRQGQLIRPHLIDIYIDELNHLLPSSKLGCHIETSLCNNFRYADELAILAPSAMGLNELLDICRKFANDNLIDFCTMKTVFLLNRSQTRRMVTKPNYYI